MFTNIFREYTHIYIYIYGGGGATHCTSVVNPGAVASHSGRRPLWHSLPPARPGFVSAKPPFGPPSQDQTKHRIDAPDRHPRRTRVGSARPHWHRSTLGAALLYHLTGPTEVQSHLRREGRSKDRGKCGRRAGDWVLSPNGPLGKALVTILALFPEDHSSKY